MATSRSSYVLSLLSLAALAAAAAVLGAAAVGRFQGPAAMVADPADQTPSAQPVEAPTTEPTQPATPEPTQESTATAQPEVPDPPAVVVIGDSSSVGDPASTWVGSVAVELGWGELTNLSSPGRGYVTAPESCSFNPCTTFIGSVDLIAEFAPDIVVTFGGTADGDYSLAGLADEYFIALREALPDADLIALSPVTGAEEAPYWLTMHRGTIAAAVQAVDGQVIDVGQPGVGDGDALSPDTHAEIAQRVIEQLEAAAVGEP